MIEIIEKKKIPYYECECYECGSRLRFTKKDMSLNHILCPVCGCSVSVVTSKGFEAGFYSTIKDE